VNGQKPEKITDVKRKRKEEKKKRPKTKTGMVQKRQKKGRRKTAIVPPQGIKISAIHKK